MAAPQPFDFFGSVQLQALGIFTAALVFYAGPEYVQTAIDAVGPWIEARRARQISVGDATSAIVHTGLSTASPESFTSKITKFVTETTSGTSRFCDNTSPIIVITETNRTSLPEVTPHEPPTFDDEQPHTSSNPTDSTRSSSFDRQDSHETSVFDNGQSSTPTPFSSSERHDHSFSTSETSWDSYDSDDSQKFKFESSDNHQSSHLDKIKTLEQILHEVDSHVGNEIDRFKEELRSQLETIRIFAITNMPSCRTIIFISSLFIAILVEILCGAMVPENPLYIPPQSIPIFIFIGSSLPILLYGYCGDYFGALATALTYGSIITISTLMRHGVTTEILERMTLREVLLFIGLSIKIKFREITRQFLMRASRMFKEHLLYCTVSLSLALVAIAYYFKSGSTDSHPVWLQGGSLFLQKISSVSTGEKSDQTTDAGKPESNAELGAIGSLVFPYLSKAARSFAFAIEVITSATTNAYANLNAENIPLTASLIVAITSFMAAIDIQFRKLSPKAQSIMTYIAGGGFVYHFFSSDYGRTIHPDNLYWMWENFPDGYDWSLCHPGITTFSIVFASCCVLSLRTQRRYEDVKVALFVCATNWYIISSILTQNGLRCLQDYALGMFSLGILAVLYVAVPAFAAAAFWETVRQHRPIRALKHAPNFMRVAIVTCLRTIVYPTYRSIVVVVRTIFPHVSQCMVVIWTIVTQIARWMLAALLWLIPGLNPDDSLNERNPEIPGAFPDSPPNNQNEIPAPEPARVTRPRQQLETRQETSPPGRSQSTRFQTSSTRDPQGASDRIPNRRPEIQRNPVRPTETRQETRQDRGRSVSPAPENKPTHFSPPTGRPKSTAPYEPEIDTNLPRKGAHSNQATETKPNAEQKHDPIPWRAPRNRPKRNPSPPPKPVPTAESETEAIIIPKDRHRGTVQATETELPSDPSSLYKPLDRIEGSSNENSERFEDPRSAGEIDKAIAKELRKKSPEIAARKWLQNKVRQPLEPRAWEKLRVKLVRLYGMKIAEEAIEEKKMELIIEQENKKAKEDAAYCQFVFDAVADASEDPTGYSSPATSEDRWQQVLERFRTRSFNRSESEFREEFKKQQLEIIRLSKVAQNTDDNRTDKTDLTLEDPQITSQPPNLLEVPFLGAPQLNSWLPGISAERERELIASGLASNEQLGEALDGANTSIDYGKMFFDGLKIPGKEQDKRIDIPALPPLISAERERELIASGLASNEQFGEALDEAETNIDYKNIFFGNMGVPGTAQDNSISFPPLPHPISVEKARDLIAAGLQSNEQLDNALDTAGADVDLEAAFLGSMGIPGNAQDQINPTSRPPPISAEREKEFIAAGLKSNEQLGNALDTAGADVDFEAAFLGSMGIPGNAQDRIQTKLQPPPISAERERDFIVAGLGSNEELGKALDATETDADFAAVFFDSMKIPGEGQIQSTGGSPAPLPSALNQPDSVYVQLNNAESNDEYANTFLSPLGANAPPNKGGEVNPGSGTLPNSSSFFIPKSSVPTANQQLGAENAVARNNEEVARAPTSAPEIPRNGNKGKTTNGVEQTLKRASSASNEAPSSHLPLDEPQDPAKAAVARKRLRDRILGVPSLSDFLELSPADNGLSGPADSASDDGLDEEIMRALAAENEESMDEMMAMQAMLMGEAGKAKQRKK
ncbi:hypothetical protein BU24DRAFT_451223 [Aaosphaeria arxii CBS 175.79]|uniref:Uncharacterized protein n=1 Tax=Aaosphaeria arxii CBS 175.79 TaxID=1450172 RepID=A0A6A5XUX9_9PLEO|nr:uncharacterized protein BU24DRAFT_451223 [Aaosphaeria arxii CBS 175.79]KAF2016763.1 hypothetical protein BU24DRAFT_451223 [Aaosphaeria arxii CBS 175.79]